MSKPNSINRYEYYLGSLGRYGDLGSFDGAGRRFDGPDLVGLRVRRPVSGGRRASQRAIHQMVTVGPAEDPDQEASSCDVEPATEPEDPTPAFWAAVRSRA